MAAGGLASFWAILGGVGTRGVSFLFFLLIARELTPAEMGVMAIGLAFAAFMEAFNEFGLFEQMVRQPDEHAPLVSSVLWLQVGAGLCSGALLLALSPLIESYYTAPGLPLVLGGVCLASLLNASVFTPTAILTRRMAFKQLALRNTLAALVGGGLGWALARHGQGVKALIAMHVFNAVTGAAMTWWTVGWRPRWVFAKPEVREALKLSFHTLGSRLLDAFTSRVDQLLIGLFFGTATLGLYAIAVRFFDVIFQSICLQLASVVLSKLSQNASDIKLTFATYMHELRQLSLIGPPLYFLAALFLPPLLVWLIGPKWKPAEPYIHVILGMGVVLAFTYSHSLFFAVIGRPQLNFLVSSISISVWLAALMFLPLLGPIFAAVLWATRMALGIPIQLFYLRKLTGMRLRDYAQRLAPMMMSCLFIALIASTMSLEGWMNPALTPVPFLSGGVLAGLVALTVLMFNSDLRHHLPRLTKLRPP